MFLRAFRGVPFLVLLCLACSADPGEQRVPAPQIVAFAADPAVIREGGTSTLRWRTSFATKVEIHEEGGAPVDLQGASAESGEVQISPAATTTYVLRATNSAGATVQKTARLEVVPANEIVARLWLEPDVVPFNQKAVLHWETQYANRVIIEQDGRVIVNTPNPSGTYEITAQDSVDFTLKAEGVLGVTETTARLHVSPAIDSFVLKGVGAPVFPGDPVDVEWRTRGADELRIVDDSGFEYVAPAGQRDRGEAKLPAPASGVFVLVASRQGVEARRELPVPIMGPPDFVSVTLDPPAVTQGSGKMPDVRITWHTTNARELRIVSSVHGVVDISGKKVVRDAVVVPAVPEGTVFTLVASNGLVEKEHVLTFGGVPLPNVVAFGATPDRVGPGDTVRLSWEVQDAARLELYRYLGGGGGTRTRVPFEREVGMTDAYDVVVEGRTIYELAAYNLAGDSTSAFVSVDIGLPSAEAQAEPRSVLPGVNFTLSWKSVGGLAVFVEDPEETVLYASDDLFVVQQGSIPLQAPSEEGVHAYAVRVANGLGEAVVPVELTVTTGPRVSSFTIAPERVRAGDEVEFAWRILPDSLGRQAMVEIRDDMNNAIDLGGTVPLEGSIRRAMTEAGQRTYVLRAWADEAQPSELEAQLTVFGDPKLQVTVEPTVYDPSRPNDLPKIRWQADWVTRLVIVEIDAEGNILRQLLEETRPPQVAQGSLAVLPAQTGSRYRVVAENPWGESVVKEVVVLHR